MPCGMNDGNELYRSQEYNVKTEKLVWPMQSATINPSSEKSLIEAKIKTVVERLRGERFLDMP
jgi:hypothetical protein